jgi:hypothetical protein
VVVVGFLNYYYYYYYYLIFLFLGGWVGFSMKISHETTIVQQQTITTEMLRLSQQTRRKH